MCFWASRPRLVQPSMDTLQLLPGCHFSNSMSHPCTCCRSVRDYQQTGTLLDDFPLPFDALPEPAALPGAGGRAGKTPAKTPARGGRRGKAAVDSPDSESEEDTGPQMPQSDSDDDEEREVRAGHSHEWARDVLLRMPNCQTTRLRQSQHVQQQRCGPPPPPGLTY